MSSIFPDKIMVLILYGSSEHGAHIWSKSGISICRRHSVTSNPIFFLGEQHVLRYHLIYVPWTKHDITVSIVTTVCPRRLDTVTI